MPPNKMRKLRLFRAIEMYLDYCDRDLGCTPKTIYGYRYQFTILKRALDDVLVSEIELDTLKDFFRGEEDRGLATSSVNTARAVIRAMFYYCQYYLRVPTRFDYKMIRAKKTDPTPVKYATPEDVNRVLSALDDYQDKIIVLALYQTTVRISELVRIKAEDVNGCEIQITRGKGRKPRLVYITEDLASALERHMLENEIYTGALFRHRVTKYSLASKGYSVSGLRNRFIRILKPKGIYAGFHWYRHGGATEMMRNGAGLKFLQEYLGHTDIRTTQRYLHITDKQKREYFVEYHPDLGNISSILDKTHAV